LGGSAVLGIVLLYRGKPSARIGILTGMALVARVDQFE
jgi:hypothetical protein